VIQRWSKAFGRCSPLSLRQPVNCERKAGAELPGHGNPLYTPAAAAEFAEVPPFHDQLGTPAIQYLPGTSSCCPAAIGSLRGLMRHLVASSGPVPTAGQLIPPRNAACRSRAPGHQGSSTRGGGSATRSSRSRSCGCLGVRSAGRSPTPAAAGTCSVPSCCAMCASPCTLPLPCADGTCLTYSCCAVQAGQAAAASSQSVVSLCAGLGMSSPLFHVIVHGCCAVLSVACAPLCAVFRCVSSI
jgi:hypothetical protein